MTAFVLKMFSSAVPPRTLDASTVLFSVRRFFSASYIEDKRSMLVRVLCFIGAVGTCLYLLFMVSVMIQGSRLPERERLLRVLEEERRVQFALLSTAQSPEKVTERATNDLQMVTVSEIQYLGQEAAAVVTAGL